MSGDEGNGLPTDSCRPTIGAAVWAVLVSIAALGCDSLALNPKRLIGDNGVLCQVMRRECIEEGRSGGQTACLRYSEPLPVSGTACTRTEDGSFEGTCNRVFCGQALVAYGYMDCTVVRADFALPGNSKSVCSARSFDFQSRVSYTQRSRTCSIADDGTCGDSLMTTVDNVVVNQCITVAQRPAVLLLQPPSENRDRSVVIDRYVENDSTCPLVAAVPPSPLFFSLGSTLGTASGGGISTAIPVQRGTVVVQQLVCDPDQGGGPCPRITRLDANVADMTIAGVQLRSVTVSTRAPANIVAGRISSHGLKLMLSGTLNGSDAFYLLENNQPLQGSATSSAFSIQGTMSVVGIDTTGGTVPVSVAVNVQGTPAPAQAITCAGLSPVQRLFGFEDSFSWASSVAQLSLRTSPLTQGCGALGISGSGYLPITGTPFPTAGLSLNSALSVDLFIPSNQPNPSWLGALQMFLSCPSGNVSNQYIGQVELTGRPKNQYSTLRFPLPAAVTSTLAQGFSDCFFTFALNVNQTGQTWSLDNLRFTP